MEVNMPQVDYTLPEVSAAEPLWKRIDDCVAGEDAVRAGGQTYLPKPAGEQDPNVATARYNAYKKRAIFHNTTGRTLEGLTGQVFTKEPQADLPRELERYQEDIDGKGTPLNQQAKDVEKHILGKGHGGLLADFPVNSTEDAITVADIESLKYRPRVLFIHPTQIRNWRVKVIGGETVLEMVNILEDAIKDGSDDGFQFETEPRWREIRLHEEDGEFYVEVQVWRRKDKPTNNEDEKFEVVEGPYRVKDYKGRDFERIPFVFVGSENNEPKIDKAPMIDIANLNIGHWRNSADYEEGCFMTGQDMLIFTGLTEEWADKYINGQFTVGARRAGALGVGMDAKLLHMDANNAALEAMKHKEERMQALGAKIIEPGAGKGTATEALMDEASETSVLASVTENVSDGYEIALYFAGLFVGDVNQDDIIYRLNNDFSSNRMTAQERQQLMAEWQGRGISFTEYRNQLRNARIATEDDEDVKAEADDSMIPGDE